MRIPAAAAGLILLVIMIIRQKCDRLETRIYNKCAEHSCNPVVGLYDAIIISYSAVVDFSARVIHKSIVFSVKSAAV